MLFLIHVEPAQADVGREGEAGEAVEGIETHRHHGPVEAHDADLHVVFLVVEEDVLEVAGADAGGEDGRQRAVAGDGALACEAGLVVGGLAPTECLVAHARRVAFPAVQRAAGVAGDGPLGISGASPELPLVHDLAADFGDGIRPLAAEDLVLDPAGGDVREERPAAGGGLAAVDEAAEAVALVEADPGVDGLGRDVEGVALLEFDLALGFAAAGGGMDGEHRAELAEEVAFLVGVEVREIGQAVLAGDHVEQRCGCGGNGHGIRAVGGLGGGRGFRRRCRRAACGVSPGWRRWGS